MEKKIKSNGHSNGMSAAIFGVAVGAASVALTHKPTRNKISKAIKNFMAEGEERMEEVGEKVDSVKNKVKSTAVRELKKAENKLSQSTK